MIDRSIVLGWFAGVVVSLLLIAWLFRNDATAQTPGPLLVVSVPPAWQCAPSGDPRAPIICKQLRGVTSSDAPQVVVTGRCR